MSFLIAFWDCGPMSAQKESVTCLQSNQFALNHDASRTTNLFQMLEFWAFASLWSGPTKVEVTHVILKSTVSQFMDRKAQHQESYMIWWHRVEFLPVALKMPGCSYFLTSLSAKPLKLSTVIHRDLWHLARFVLEVRVYSLSDTAIARQ